MASIRLLLTRLPAGRLEGSLTLDGDTVEHRFSGTLELLGLLENLADADVQPRDDSQ